MPYYQTIISVAELAALTDQPIIIDCTFDLADPAAGKALYLEGHIPTARYLDLNQDLSGPVTEQSGRHPLPGADQLTTKLRQLGVDGSSQVIVYDANHGAYAARAWWLIRALGHVNVAVLDGGKQAWEAAQKPLQQAQVQANTGNFTGNDSFAAPSISAQELCSSLAQESLLIVDSREPSRYRGEFEPIDPIAGHIPCAKNMPWLEASTNSGRYPPKEWHIERWRGIDTENSAVYCGSGVTACTNLLSQAIAGLPMSKLFVGSWSQWAKLYPDLVATGDVKNDRS